MDVAIVAAALENIGRGGGGGIALLHKSELLFCISFGALGDERKGAGFKKHEHYQDEAVRTLNAAACSWLKALMEPSKSLLELQRSQRRLQQERATKQGARWVQGTCRTNLLCREPAARWRSERVRMRHVYERRTKACSLSFSAIGVGGS